MDLIAFLLTLSNRAAAPSSLSFGEGRLGSVGSRRCRRDAGHERAGRQLSRVAEFVRVSGIPIYIDRSVVRITAVEVLFLSD